MAVENQTDASPDQTLAPSLSEADESTDYNGPLDIGTLVNGRYEIQRLLGVGGMGAVYKALHRGIGRSVAVKVLNAGRDTDPNVLRRFMIEARAAGKARHRNIVEVMDFGADGPLHWMVQELLEGEALEDFIAREAPVSPERVAAIMDPLLRALAHAHAQGIIHRDLKPGNIFLARENGVEGVVPKLLDFGIARHDDGDARLTSTETIVGTPAYMSPEQIESSKNVTEATDQYAMGCVAYELLTGALPYDASSIHMLLVKKVTEEPAPLSRRALALPAPLSECVMRSIARRPEERFADVNGFRVALIAAARGDAARDSSPSITTGSLPACDPAPEARPPVSASSGRAPPVGAADSIDLPVAPAGPGRRLFAEGLIAGLAVIVAGIALMRDRGREQPHAPAAAHAAAARPPAPAPPTPLPSPPPAPAAPEVVQPPAAAVVVAARPPRAESAPSEPSRPRPRPPRRPRAPTGRLSVDPTNPL